MTATETPKHQTTTPDWQGINHLALITTDMDATVRFYHGMLGAQLVATLGTPEFRHYFFEFGPHCTVAFFEYTTAPTEPFKKAAGTPDPRAAQFDHLALNLPDEAALIDLEHRLKNAKCDVTDVIDHGSVRSVYFTDPNGIALEASWWVHDPTGHAATYNNPEHFADPNPVPAFIELQNTGNLTAAHTHHPAKPHDTHPGPRSRTPNNDPLSRARQSRPATVPDRRLGGALLTPTMVAAALANAYISSARSGPVIRRPLAVHIDRAVAMR